MGGEGGRAGLALQRTEQGSMRVFELVRERERDFEG